MATKAVNRRLKMKLQGTNKLRMITNTIAMSLFAVMAMPFVSSAQEEKKEHHHYRLVDIGTLGGPNSFFSGPILQILNNRGTFVAIANTPAANPNPGCNIPFSLPDCFVEHAAVWHDGTLIDLGVLPGGVNSQTVTINANGLIAGGSENGLIDPLTGQAEIAAVLWEGHKAINLGSLPGGTESLAVGVNSHGQVIGFANNDVLDAFSAVGFPTQTRAFLWQNGVMKDLGTLGGMDAVPNVINEQGQIAGFSYTDSTNQTTGAPIQDPFFWQDGKMTDLGTLGGTVGTANWMNNRGQVAGTSNLAGDATHHAFLWDEGKLIDLGTLGGIRSEAWWISESGFVVGRADVPGSKAHHAFRWRNGVMTDLGLLPLQTCSTAVSANSRGQVVGETAICGASISGPAFLSEHGEPMVDVNTLIVPASDLNVVDAFDINDCGEIAAHGNLSNGDSHAVLLIPCDENHANVEGCDYEPVEAVTEASVRAAQIVQAQATASDAKLSPAEEMTRLRALMASHNRRFGTRPNN
jgi:probable HAF family extracellular repeat protein